MRRRLIITTEIAILIVIAASAAASGSLSHGALWANVLRIILVLASVFALVWIIFLTTDIEPPPGIGIPKPLLPTKDEIALAYFNIARTYNAQALKLLVNIMIDMPHYLERINEDVALEEETPELQVTTRQVFRVRTPVSAPVDASGQSGSTSIPSAKEEPRRPENGREEPTLDHLVNDGVILVPIVLVEKGTLLDGFKVTDSSGNDVATLSYNQTRGLLAHVVETIINIAPEQDTGYVIAEREKRKDRVRANLVTAICAPGPKKKKAPAERSRINNLLNSVQDLPIEDEWKKRIRDFCETLADYYVIVAEGALPAGGYVILTYSQKISVDSSVRGVINRLRGRLGLRYSAIDIPLNIFALEVEAYHMEMNAAPMQYVFDHHLERMNSKVLVTQDNLWQGKNKPYARLHYNSAGPSMHLYIRRQSDEVAKNQTSLPAADPTERSHSGLPAERLKSVVEFREIPPGALGAAAVISLATAIIISFFALTQIGQEPVSARTPIIIGSDIPALIIALPGFASVVIGSWLDLSHLRRASLSTYMGLGASVALSLTSALYFLYDANKVAPGRISLSVTNELIIRTDIGWLILAVAAITFSLFLVRDVISNSRYYSNQIKKRVNRHT